MDDRERDGAGWRVKLCGARRAMCAVLARVCVARREVHYWKLPILISNNVEFSVCFLLLRDM